MNGYDDHDEVIILRTYNNVWKIDRKIYSIEGFKLLFPISPNEALYFIVSMSFSILLIKVIPFYGRLHGAIKFGLVPYAIMKFFTKQKLDGKLPHKFFFDYVVYKLSPKKYARFAPVEEFKSVRISTPIVYRTKEIIDKTEQVIKKDKKIRRKRQNESI